MLAQTYAPAVLGIDGRLISIECDITSGLPGFVVVGLGDKAVDESRQRIRSAIKNSELTIPPKRITLNLAPADLPKDGSGYDLGMAVAILAASGQIEPALISDSLFLGELALNGAIRPVKGALTAASLISERSLKRLFVPTDNAAEANLLPGVKVFPVSSLRELYLHLTGTQLLSNVAVTASSKNSTITAKVDLAMIYGQTQAKRAIEIATAGGHNILLTGPPGTGKTLLAKSIMSLLPKPSLNEIIEITKLHSLAGYNQGSIQSERPFRSPHHTASSIALVGGGVKPRPGEISLSHGGVLFLDELPEFPRNVIEALRQPLEDGQITVARAAGVTTFPARFMLVATSNPCPCGYKDDPRNGCDCTAASINRYQRKLSGPLLDRIDLVVKVTQVDTAAIIGHQTSESSQIVATRIARARQIQTNRLGYDNAVCNGQMNNKDILEYCKLDNETSTLASLAMRELGLSARSYNRLLKVARTIADLEGSATIKQSHFAEAIQYRPINTAMKIYLPTQKPVKPRTLKQKSAKPLPNDKPSLQQQYGPGVPIALTPNPPKQLQTR